VTCRYLIGDVEIIDRCPGDIESVSWRYLIGVFEIFGGCPADI